MDARTVLLTANTETVYAISHLELTDDLGKVSRALWLRLIG